VFKELDSVARYAMNLGIAIRPRTVLVEGITDAQLFDLAGRLEREATGINLLGDDLAITAAGDGEKGGANGVIRELICLRGLARTCLLPNGRPRYRFVGLFDNDMAGRQAVKTIRQLDTSVQEYKDVFRLWPVMPLPPIMDPGTMQKTFERENSLYKGLDCELEDLLPSTFVDVYLSEHSSAILSNKVSGDKVHREFTREGKAGLHRFVKENAVREDLGEVIGLIKAIRFYLLL